jgi:chlorophyll synthase
MALPAPSAIAELLKPVTWFPPMWAFACGVVASGTPWTAAGRWWLVGVLLAGPLVCATSQAVNDWFDRHVDAINEPQRPIPSGRMPGRWGLYVAVAWTAAVAAGGRRARAPGASRAALLGLPLAWAYSAPPLRLKRNGWWGNAACGLSLRGPGLGHRRGRDGRRRHAGPALVWLLALLYSVGAHGIMTLNDFKSVAGDRQHGRAARCRCSWASTARRARRAC